jgi:UDP-glucose 4-epimerase
MQILVTGAAGKVGQALLGQLADAYPKARIRALLRNRNLPEIDLMTTMRGSLSDRAVAEAVVAGCSHVVHLATC